MSTRKEEVEKFSDSDLWQNQRPFLAWKLIADENYEQGFGGGQGRSILYVHDYTGVPFGCL
jgi:hypothetical protein